MVGVLPPKRTPLLGAPATPTDGVLGGWQPSLDFLTQIPGAIQHATGWQPGTTPQWVPDWLRNLSDATTAMQQRTQQNLAALPPRYAMTPQDINTAMSLGMSGGTIGEGGGLKADVPDWIKNLSNRKAQQVAPAVPVPGPFENPYQDSLLRQAWDNGNKAAGKRYANRSSNPHFDQSMGQAWNDGFDAKLAAKAAKRAAK